MKLYLCGPMTGIKQYNFPKFMKAARRLRDAGYDVVNPAEHAILAGFDPIANPDIVCTSEMRRKFLDNDKNLLDTCDGIALMYGWANSKGCDEEVTHFFKTHSISAAKDVNEWRRQAFDDLLGVSIQRDERPATQEDIQAVVDGKPLPHTPPSIRTFATGATRDTDIDKFDYDGFLCPLVLERYAEYMHANRWMADGSMRGSDNWKNGIPQDVYRKSGWRHFFSFWKHCLIGDKADAMRDACALLFNIMGWMHEELKHGEEQGKR